jgi:trehalose synthase-fused probable maltokinase
VSDEPALTRFVREQRWFGSKSRALRRGRVVDSGPLPQGCVLAFFEAEFAEGDTALYQLPYRVEAGGELQLSLSDPALGHALLAALRHSQPVATGYGRVDFELTGPLPGESELEPVRPVGGEQSNSSIVFGERAILKAYRRLEPGESPELELLRFLAAHGFEHIPRLLGWYRYTGSRITATLGILQAFVPDARDGWEDALESFAHPAPFLARLRRLGEVTARMHGVLASDAGDAAFQPEPIGGPDLARVAEADAQSLLGGLPAGGAAEPVRARAGDVLERLRALAPLRACGQAIRQHGDYHLGQVLWDGDDWLVLDFEGEPARPLPERRRKSSPLRDVAGMLRSFAYAAETRRSQGDASAPDWEDAARAAFLGGYEAAADPALLPPDDDTRAQVLAACELEKALYELRYELDNRPDWAHVPVAGILRLLDGR